MTIQETYNFIENLKIDTTEKSEIKVYEELLHILSRLKIREFSQGEIKSIETELDRFNLESNPEKRKKYYKKALSKFQKYLKGYIFFNFKRILHQTGCAIRIFFWDFCRHYYWRAF